MSFKEIIEQQLIKEKELAEQQNEANKRLENSDRYMGSIRLNQTTKDTEYVNAIAELNKAISECEKLNTEYTDKLAAAKAAVDEIQPKQQQVLQEIATLPATVENDAKYKELTDKLNQIRKDLADHNKQVSEVTASLEENNNTLTVKRDELLIQQTAYEKFTSVVSRGDDIDLTGLAYGDILTPEEFADVINPYVEDYRTAGRNTSELLNAINNALNNNQSLFISDFHNRQEVNTDLDSTIQLAAAEVVNTDQNDYVFVGENLETNELEVPVEAPEPIVIDEALMADPVIKETNFTPTVKTDVLTVDGKEYTFNQLPDGGYRLHFDGKEYKHMRDMEDAILDVTQPLPAVPAEPTEQVSYINTGDDPNYQPFDFEDDVPGEVTKIQRNDESFRERLFKSVKFKVAVATLLLGVSLYSLIAGQQPIKVVNTVDETASNDEKTSGNEVLDVPTDAIGVEDVDTNNHSIPMSFTFGGSDGTRYKASTSDVKPSSSSKSAEQVVADKNEQLQEEADERQEEHETTHGDEGAGADTHVTNPEAGGPIGEPLFPDTTPADEGLLDDKDPNIMFGNIQPQNISAEATPVPEVQTFSKGEVIDLSSQVATRTL